MNDLLTQLDVENMAGLDENQIRAYGIMERLFQHQAGSDAVRNRVTTTKMRDELASRIRLPNPGARLKAPNPLGTMYDFSENATMNGRMRQKMEDETDLLNSYYGLFGVVDPEYDMLEPWTILDTESYMIRANRRRHNLMFRNGFTFTSQDRPNLAEYVSKRASQIGYVMRRSFRNFLKQVLWNLEIVSNCFLVKIRDNDASGGVKSDRNGNLAPVAAYEIIPAHTLFPFLDGYGRISNWRRFFGDGRPWRDYDVRDIVHLYWDRKPGHIFGTPRSTTVKDDIFALRRIEENAELLLVSYMFPFTHIKIGTEQAPCQYLPGGMSEVDMYRDYVQNMPKEGVLITDERVSVEIKGGEGKGVDSTPLRDHYKARVYIGFGVSPVDMGEVDKSSSNSADNASQNLKDDVKADLDWFCEQFKYSIMVDWFEEAPFKVSVQNAVAEVELAFHELDPDAQIKSEEHHLNMFNNNAVTHDELRHRIKARKFSEEDHNDTHHKLHVMSMEEYRTKTQKELLRMNAQISAAQTGVQAKADEKLIKANVKLTQAQAKLEQHKAKTQATKNAAPAPSPGSGAKKKAGRPASTGRSSRSNPVKAATPKAKVSETIAKPRNQHGVNLDPHKAKSSDEFFEIIHDSLVGAFRGLAVTETWADVSKQTLSAISDQILSDEQKNDIWGYVSRATDEDLLYVYLKSCFV